ncbi:hypothetical protein [Nocardioides rubriscoriae]|uniref:hypothetical protein n=1 Tax=Nocardioides rubriscoriae TaxID=642762 RepID=UPI0011DF7A94|nr:hypothetical protein [Nocardioides rubriscoriae]
MHTCTSDEINNGKTMRSIDLLHQPFKMTHATRRRIPADVVFSHAVSMTKQNVVEASIKATAKVKAEAGAFFAKAEVEAGIELAGRYQHTSTTSVTDTFTLPASSKERVFVFYDGVDLFQMRAHLRTCDRSGQNDYYGNLTTFNPIDESGAVQCPHTRYRKGTISYQVSLGAGC